MSKDKEKEMSFLDHLEVLRWTLVRSSLYIIGFGILAFLFKDFIFNNIILKPKDPNFITYRVLCALSQKFGTSGLCIDEIPFIVQSRTMAGQFSAHIWTAITTGFIVAFPFVMREFWKFIEPGLYDTERKNARVFIFVSSFLFFIGILFGYFVIAPVSVNFLGSYRVAEEVKNNIDLSSYIGLIKASSLASGFIFELPIVVYFLTKMGLVTPQLMIQYRKYALVAVLVLAAIITPPDVVSQIIVAIPMIILYQISIYISKYIVKKEKKKEAKEAKENTDVSIK